MRKRAAPSLLHSLMSALASNTTTATPSPALQQCSSIDAARPAPCARLSRRAATQALDGDYGSERADDDAARDVPRARVALGSLRRTSATSARLQAADALGEEPGGIPLVSFDSLEFNGAAASAQTGPLALPSEERSVMIALSR